MLAFSFFAAIFSSFLWVIYSVAYINDNTVGIKLSSLGMVDLSIYVALVLLPIFVLWMIFGYINQHINNQKTSKALYQLFIQMKKNQDYTDLVARIMLESEQQIKDGFIMSRIDILISDMNELIAEVINRAALASREQIESLWSRVRNGGKWALGKVIIEINQNQPNFQMRLYEKSQNDAVLAGTILEFCARYQNILALLNKHDSERVFLNVIETGVFGKVFTILAPLSDEIRKHRESAFFSRGENEVEFKAPEMPAQKKQAFVAQPMPQPEMARFEKAPTIEPQENKKSFLSGLNDKIGSFIKKRKENRPAFDENYFRDPFSVALERSFSDEEDNVIDSDFAAKEPLFDAPAFDENQAPEVVFNEADEEALVAQMPEETPSSQTAPVSFAAGKEPLISSPQETEFEVASVVQEDPKAEPAPLTNTQKTLNSLRQEWEDMRKNTHSEPQTVNVSEQEPQKKEQISEEKLIYPFGGWTDETNYK